jgi:N-acetylmuramoyl-L-alanine amidase
MAPWIVLLLLLLSSGTAWAAPLVAIDVGHSVAIPGALSARGRPEFEFNAELADALTTALDAIGISSILIGRDGQTADLMQRVRAAGQSGARLLLSIHHDSAQAQLLSPWMWQGTEQRFNDGISGYSLFVSRKNPEVGRSLVCATSIGRELKQAGLHATEHHAAHIAGEFKPWADRSAGVLYYDNLVVLRHASIPAVLIEAGVILNRDDELLLGLPEHQQRLARAIARGAAHCLGRGVAR